MQDQEQADEKRQDKDKDGNADHAVSFAVMTCLLSVAVVDGSTKKVSS
jgi:hypothetical protein